MVRASHYASSMTVLAKRETWTKLRAANAARQSLDLTAEEAASVRAALRFLRTRLGGAEKLAAALRAPVKLVEKFCAAKGRPSAAIAIRTARAACVSVEDLLSGAWPPAGACAHCGRS
jgi:hypothetical protein